MMIKQETTLICSQNLTNVLLLEDPLLNPVLMMDNRGGDSSDEYSGVETSDSEFDFGSASEVED